MASKSATKIRSEKEQALAAVKENQEDGELEYRGNDFKLDNGIRLRVVDIVDIDSGRWCSYHTSVVQVAHEDWGTIPYFVAYDFERGLTEYQEGSEEPPSDPYLVTPRQVQTTVWDKVK